MKRLLLGTAVAAAILGAVLPAFSMAAHASGASDALTHCLERNYQPGSDTTGNGGHSALRLLKTCPTEWQGIIDDCATGSTSGDGMKVCRLAPIILVQSFLFLKEGRPLPPSAQALMR
jgi:hypothetical protein